MIEKGDSVTNNNLKYTETDAIEFFKKNTRFENANCCSNSSYLIKKNDLPKILFAIL